MKKILLMMVAFVATFSAFAEDKDDDFWGGWEQSFKPVEVDDTEDLDAPRTAVANDGSVFVSSTYTKAFAFAGKALADPEDMSCACIVKYNNKGEEQWAVSFVGNATVSDMAVDAEGNLYAAGIAADEVKYTGTDGKSATIKGYDTCFPAFVAKISKDGKFLAMKTIVPETNAVIAAAEGPDPWGEVEGMVPLYQSWDPLYVSPNKIQIDGDKVYVSATYMGDVTELGWKGSYLDMFGMSYSDNLSSGVFSLSANDLSGAANVATVQMTGVIAENQYYPEAISFVAENGTVYVGFFGFGDLTLATSSASKDFSFDYGKHPFVLATIKNGSVSSAKTFEAAAHGKIAKPYKVEMDMDGENIIIGGTFYGELPFDNSKTSGAVGKDDDGDPTYSLASDIFITSVKKDGAVNWAAVGAKESKAIAMIVTGEEIHCATTVGNYTIKTATGAIELDDDDDTALLILSDASAWDDDYAAVVLMDKDEVFVISRDMKSDNTVIEDIDAPVAEDGQLFNLLGQPVDENYKGVAITADGKKVYLR